MKRPAGDHPAAAEILFCSCVPAGVELKLLRGQYNPLTLEGSIVVDGIAASVFTADGGMSPATTHALLAPLRWWYRAHPTSYLAAHDVLAHSVTWLNDVPIACATALGQQVWASAVGSFASRAEL